jgi:hypothetical protein
MHAPKIGYLISYLLVYINILNLHPHCTLIFSVYDQFLACTALSYHRSVMHILFWHFGPLPLNKYSHSCKSWQDYCKQQQQKGRRACFLFVFFLFWLLDFCLLKQTTRKRGTCRRIWEKRMNKNNGILMRYLNILVDGGRFLLG